MIRAGILLTALALAMPPAAGLAQTAAPSVLLPASPPATVLLSGPAVDPSTAPALGQIRHIVVIFMENRSFDSMFGRFPGANGLANADQGAVQIDAGGKPYAVLPRPVKGFKGEVDVRFPATLPNQPFEMSQYVPMAEKTGDLIHAFYQEQLQINDGAMNRFVRYSNAAGLAMGYYDTSGTFLWKLAQEYTLGDAMFHSAFGGSFLNHAMLVCSCAYRFPNAPEALTARLDEHGGLVKDGQVTPDGYAVNTLRSVYLHGPKDDPAKLVPPQTDPHIGDRMDAAGVSWKWYAGGYNEALAGHAPEDFQYHHQPFQYFADLAPGTPAQKAHLQDYDDFVRDVKEGTLPQVVFYKPIGALNEHPGYAEIVSGDRHLAEVVGMLRENQDLWEHTLLLITYDEHGGAWDHVAPPRRDRWGPGTRVPLIAAGGVVRRGHVDHTPYDFGSILRTIGVRFGVAPVNEIDANAYPMLNFLRAAGADMAENTR